MAIDTHMHINSIVTNNFDDDIKSINNGFLEKVINVGLNFQTSKEGVIIADSNSKFYSSVGIHPLYIEGEEINSLISLLDDDKKIVAIGEIGLDTLNDNLESQQDYLIKQIDIANNYHLPVIIHANNTNQKIIQIFDEYISPKYGCVFHCFQPNLEILDELIKRGYYISFAGRVTYQNAKKSLEVAKRVPNDLFLIETDSPYISPEPKKIRNW